uniref:HTH myb-type domain-containing protein n=1 Tax=Oryza meridionalis TaxID=40149 RepID=A0A0E0D997_9ORYZ
MGDLVGDGATPSAAEPAPAAAGRWTRQKDKLLEMLVARHAITHGQRVGGWDAIAAAFGDDRTVAQVEQRYGEIAAEVRRVMEEPWDAEDPTAAAAAAAAAAPVKHAAAEPGSDGGGGEGKVVVEKKSGAWSNEEHRQCLRGIEEIGAGHWTQISIEYVPSRTPIQIASHSQKYFLRMAKPKEDRKRKSIHDTPYHLHLPNAADAHAHQQQQ